MKSLVTGVVIGTLVSAQWTGSGDLKEIQKNAEEFANKATAKIASLKEEIEVANANKDDMINKIKDLQNLVNDLRLESSNENATSQTLYTELKKSNDEIEKANKEVKDIAKDISEILDLQKLD